MEGLFWIKVSDHLPDTERQVLICSRSKKGVKSYKTGYYSYSSTCGGWVTQGTAEVIAWAEIPVYDPENQIGYTPSLEAAIKEIREHYKIAQDNGSWIQHPLAWSLYQVWKMVETGYKTASKRKESNHD